MIIQLGAFFDSFVVSQCVSIKRSTPKTFYALMNEMECPQSFSEMRSFQRPQPTSFKERVFKDEPGSVCTFMIRVMFRQNASWQGRLTWANKKREESFRSVLELLFLIDNAAYSE